VNPLNELTCLELVDLVTEYFEGALAVAQRARFEAHLEQCRHCRRYVEQLRRTISTLGELKAEEIPRHVRDELLKTFRGWKRRG